MALSPTQLDRLPDNMVQLMSELQDEIISDICRRITKADVLTPTAEWQLYKANQLTISSREVKRRIAAKLKVQERELKDLYTESVKTAIAEDAKIYKIAIAEGILSDDYRGKLTNYTRSAAFTNALKKGLKNTNGLMRNLTNSAAAMANRQLSDALDLCYLEVTSGAFTPQEAYFKAVQKLGADGIKVVNYASGRTDQLDVAVRRAVVTSIGKTCGDMQLDLAHEMDCQLVEVSSHLGARPSHAEWQGRIYSLVKGHPKYPYFYDATGYGTGDGLCGWFCRHSFFPYFEGLSKPANEPNFSLAENEQVYKDTQKQRSYERAIRKSKRELAALDGARSATDDPALVAKLDREFERKSVTLKRREAALAEHLKATGLLPDNSRVRVDGFGRSVSQKAVWANKRATSITVKAENYKGSKPKPEKYFKGAHYMSKFNNFTQLNLSGKISVYKAAKKCILDNYDKESESMLIVDLLNKKTFLAGKGGIEVKASVKFGEKNQYILVHNHFNNSPLSLEDIVSASERKDIQMIVAASHDGKVYWLEIGDGKRLDVTSKMLKDSGNYPAARDLSSTWGNSVKKHNGDHFLALQDLANRYNWKVGVF